jgi:outer membrane protein TolC
MLGLELLMTDAARIRAAHRYLLKAQIAYQQARRLLPEEVRDVLSEQAPAYTTILALRQYLEALQPSLHGFQGRKLALAKPVPYDLDAISSKKGQ